MCLFTAAAAAACMCVCMLTNVLLAVICEGTGVQGGAPLTPHISRGAGYCALFENQNETSCYHLPGVKWRCNAPMHQCTNARRKLCSIFIHTQTDTQQQQQHLTQKVKPWGVSGLLHGKMHRSPPCARSPLGFGDGQQRGPYRRQHHRRECPQDYQPRFVPMPTGQVTYHEAQKCDLSCTYSNVTYHERTTCLQQSAQM